MRESRQKDQIPAFARGRKVLLEALKLESLLLRLAKKKIFMKLSTNYSL